MPSLDERPLISLLSELSSEQLDRITVIAQCMLYSEITNVLVAGIVNGLRSIVEKEN
jgi:hypothetical protein